MRISEPAGETEGSAEAVGGGEGFQDQAVLLCTMHAPGQRKRLVSRSIERSSQPMRALLVPMPAWFTVHSSHMVHARRTVGEGGEALTQTTLLLFKPRAPDCAVLR